MFRKGDSYLVCVSLIFGFMLHRDFHKRHPEEIRTFGGDVLNSSADIIWKKLFSFSRFGLYKKVGTLQDWKRDRIK